MRIIFWADQLILPKFGWNQYLDMTKDDKVFGIMTRFIFKVTLEKLLSLGKNYRICESSDVSKFTKIVWAGK